MVFRFTHKGDPIPFNRPRFKGKRGFNTPRYAAYKKAVVASAISAMFMADMSFPLIGPLKVYANFTRANRRAVDLDNLVKAILDAMQDAGVYVNDHQVIRLYASKSVNKATAGVSVIVREAGA